MNFAELVTFWRMKDMVKSDTCLYEKPIYDSENFHAVMHMKVGNGHNIADILYTFNDGRMRLLNADIMFSSYGDKDDRVWIKNAKLHQLADHVSA